MSAPYVVIPQAIYEARDAGSISAEGFNIFVWSYRKAERPEFRVRSYSAEQVCRFCGEDADDATLKRYQRAAANLVDRFLIKSDYYRIDPTRSRKDGRTYSIWLPDPDRFRYVGTPEENRVSLWQGNVGLIVGDNVALPVAASDSKQTAFAKSETDNVSVIVALPPDQLSFTNQETKKIERERPLNPPAGGLAPSAPEGERCAGRATRKALSPEQVGQWHDLSERFSLLFRAYFAFHPEPDLCNALVRKCSPLEIWAAVQRACAEDYGHRPGDKLLGVFFRREAAARINQMRKVGIVAPKLNQEWDAFGQHALQKATALDQEWRTLFDSGN